MARNPDNIRSKIQIPAGITPINDNSSFPSHYSDFGFGGLRTVDNITQRDAIPALRRVDGMLVYVVSDTKYYRLSGGITNTDWVLFESGSGIPTNEFKTIFVLSDWILQSSGLYRITFNHGLNNTAVEYKMHLTDGCPVSICPVVQTSTQLTFETQEINRFSGRIFVES